MNMVQASRKLLMVGVAASVLSACGGADDVASPGEGTIIGGGNSGGGTTTPPPVSTGPAASCPTGTTDRGVNPVVNRRNCGLPARIASSLSLPKVAGLFYSIDGRVDVGTDVGGDGAAAGGQAATLSIDPGVVVIGQSQASFLVVNRGSQIVRVGEGRWSPSRCCASWGCRSAASPPCRRWPARRRTPSKTEVPGAGAECPGQERGAACRAQHRRDHQRDRAGPDPRSY